VGREGARCLVAWFERRGPNLSLRAVTVTGAGELGTPFEPVVAADNVLRPHLAALGPGAFRLAYSRFEALPVGAHRVHTVDLLEGAGGGSSSAGGGVGGAGGGPAGGAAGAGGSGGGLRTYAVGCGCDAAPWPAAWLLVLLLTVVRVGRRAGYSSCSGCPELMRTAKRAAPSSVRA
jgi:hypothetical protein